MTDKDIRWKQRFGNFQNSLHYLEEAMKIKNPDIIQKAGLIQFFEMSFELSWNVLKDYLEEQGFAGIKSPRDTIKKAFQIDLITNGHVWMEALENRNLTSHTYDEKTADRVTKNIIAIYYPLLKEVSEVLKNK
jgi:nucleotidyltransferase substrate binding protein (TIGR01987 family)